MADKLLNYCLNKPFFRTMETASDVYTAVKKTAVQLFMDTFCDIDELMNPEVIREVTEAILKGKEVVPC